ncbi:2-succinyl-6-hydroxy-2,4-cyclohexadiene-1-carboxylate synthase [Lentibacillus lipolyticus]|nr:2-succinyl-6-hydroxy-2,4-cyclohexadiene-1-carboxylate synthase [Lentibacillus lipolyticus]
MYIAVNDRIYWCNISGEGEPVVLLHGFTGTCDTWEPVIHNWLKNYRTIAIDLPGHGNTASHPNNMKAFCHDLANILDHLQLDQVHLIGYSLGGRTALSFAMLHSERVATLTLESSSPGLDGEEQRLDRQSRDEKLASWIRANGTQAFVDYWEKLPLFRTQQSLPESVQQRIRKERLAQSAEGLAQSLVTMGTGVQPSWWGKLITLDLPVLLLTGEKDAKFLAINREMDERLPISDLYVVKDAGHAIHVEQPHIFGKIVNEFF